MMRRIAIRVGLVLFWLLVIDGAVLLAKVRWPESKLAAIARNQESLESRIAGQFDSEGRPRGSHLGLVHAGWTDAARENYRWADAPGKLRVTVYGMSFSSDVGRELRGVDPSLTVRLVDAPTSTTSHSLALAEVDPEPGQVAVLGILVSQVAKEGAMLGAHISVGNLAPFTSPAMVEEDDGAWRRIEPSLRTLSDFGRAISSSDETWQEFVAQMRAHDPLYSPFVFDRSWLDYSFVVGLVRRAWDRSVEERAEARRWSEDGDRRPSGIRLLEDVVRRFAVLTRARGECPVVLVIQTFRGSRDACTPISELGEELAIPVLCTEAVIEASDAANFKPDRHYTDRASRTIAEKLLPLIRGACEHVAGNDR